MKKMYDNEVPKHKKRSKKKGRKRSNHKHKYDTCILHIRSTDSYYLCDYCTICGRINDYYFDTEPAKPPYHVIAIGGIELYKKYKDKYEVKYINDWRDKFVHDIKKED